MKKYFGKNSKWRPFMAKYVDLTYFWPNFGILLKLKWILQENWTEEKDKTKWDFIHTYASYKKYPYVMFPNSKKKLITMFAPQGLVNR